MKSIRSDIYKNVSEKVREYTLEEASDWLNVKIRLALMLKILGEEKKGFFIWDGKKQCWET